jgi:hypothetical protein
MPGNWSCPIPWTPILYGKEESVCRIPTTVFFEFRQAEARLPKNSHGLVRSGELPTPDRDSSP